MNVYHLDDVPLRQIYHTSNRLVEVAYDLHGDIVYRPFDIVVMSYNVQHFDGINAQADMQNKIISKWNPDIIGLQEMPNQNPLPEIAQNMLDDYNLVVFDYLAVASKMAMAELTEHIFENQDPEELSRWGQRKYIVGYIRINNKRICIIDTHLCALHAEYGYAQMMEILEFVAEKPYFIIFADFNFGGLAVRDAAFIEMYKPCIDAGYHLANCTDDSNFKKTFTNAAIATKQINLSGCPDNIITSGNIDILTTTYDVTKFNYLTGDSIDHIPIISYLKIN